MLKPSNTPATPNSARNTSAIRWPSCLKRKSPCARGIAVNTRTSQHEYFECRQGLKERFVARHRVGEHARV